MVEVFGIAEAVVVEERWGVVSVSDYAEPFDGCAVGDGEAIRIGVQCRRRRDQVRPLLMTRKSAISCIGVGVGHEKGGIKG